MSAYPLRADMLSVGIDVSNVPIGEVLKRSTFCAMHRSAVSVQGQSVRSVLKPSSSALSVGSDILVLCSGRAIRNNIGASLLGNTADA